MSDLTLELGAIERLVEHVRSAKRGVPTASSACLSEAENSTAHSRASFVCVYTLPVNAFFGFGTLSSRCQSIKDHLLISKE